ncbi:hypothetical protein M408DRAFT_325498 [Serendipita vermifera MAFF 305830]|uniref:Armadillo-like helical domain-containing protein n=1 Tax=Serendipita vermifera MAFF 305830 TaxID=933852 RepID=A0A0C3BAU4_SERVB|nr:hypothetical protein M408DRAFT_325498 [Serendipita vermifera MAFF 305830]
MTLHQTLWVLGRHRIRLEYHWAALWRSLFSLLEFVSSRVDNVRVLGRVEELVEETLITLEFAALSVEKLMPSPEALVDFVYETIRSKSTIEKQMDLLASLEVPTTDKPRGAALSVHAQAVRAIATIEGIARYYEGKISAQGEGFEIGDVMKVIGAEVERDGVRIEASREPDAPPRRSEASNSENFVKWACIDGLALMS